MDEPRGHVRRAEPGKTLSGSSRSRPTRMQRAAAPGRRRVTEALPRNWDMRLIRSFMFGLGPRARSMIF